MKAVALVCSIVLALFITPFCRAQEGLSPAERAALQAIGEATVSLDVALQKAAEQEQDTILMRAHLTMKDGVARWGVEVLSGEVFRTFWFDAKTGELALTENRKADGSAQRHRMFHEQGGVGFSEASRIARVELDSAVTHDVRSNLSGEALTYDVLMMQRERPMLVRVDASGGVIEVRDAPRPLNKKQAK